MIIIITRIILYLFIKRKKCKFNKPNNTDNEPSNELNKLNK